MAAAFWHHEQDGRDLPARALVANDLLLDVRVRAALGASRIVDDAGTVDGLGVRAGDVIFGRRPSWVQQLLGLAGDFLSHCGIVFDHDGELRVAEFGPPGAFSRSLVDFVDAYETYAFVRLAAHATCRERVVASALDRIDRNSWTYCWPAGVLLDAGLVARRFAPSTTDRRVSEATIALAHRIHRRYGDDAITCAGFVLDCLADVCERCRPSVTWPTRPRVAGWRTSPSITDARSRASQAPADPAVVRLLVSPFDLWVSLRSEFRVVVDGDRADVLYDFLDPRPPASPTAIAA